MGDVIKNTRFKGRSGAKKSEILRRKFARRPMSRRVRRDIELPDPRVWRR